MKWMDEKGRLLGKLHIFDLLVVLLVLVGVAGMASRLLKPLGRGAELHHATYTMDVVSVQEFGVTAFSVGDTLYEQDVAIGTITKVEVQPALTPKTLADGTTKQVAHKLYYSVLLTVETDRMRQEKGYYVDTQELLNGTTHSVSNGFILCDATIREIDFK